MKFNFSEVKIPEITNTLEPANILRLKKDLIAVLLTQRTQVFDREAAGMSGPWQPLSNRHQAKRVAKIPKNRRASPNAVKILQDTGVLRNSFSDGDGPGSEQRIEEILPDGVRLATGVEYAAIHNEGGVISHPGTSNGFGRGIEIPAHSITIPARPFDEFSTEDETEINQITELHVNGQL